MKSSPLLAALVMFPSFALAGELPNLPAKAPALTELRDQYDAPQTLSFPATNIVLLTIADRKGSEQIDGWVAALKTRYAGRVEMRGLADFTGVPSLWRSKVRKKFQEKRAYPVMLDWFGTNCAQFGFQPGVPNVLLIARDGMILERFSGPPGEAALKQAFEAMDATLDRSDRRRGEATQARSP